MENNIADKEVIMLKLYNGDYVIGEYDGTKTTDNEYTLNNPRVFVFMPTMTGTMKAGFQPVCFFNKASKTAMEFRKEQVMLVVSNVDIPKEVENGYKSEVSGISIASANDIAAVNGSKDKAAGDFIL